MDNFNQSINTAAPVSQQSSPVFNDKKSTGLIVAMAVCATLAVIGVGFGIYGLVGSSQKSQQISSLEADVKTKDAKIAELETEISQSIPPTAPETITDDSTVRIVLGEKLAGNETQTTFKIGECSADGPSVKCSVVVNELNALISYVSTDSILRLTMPNV